jgi:hypothetical protein
MCSVMHRYLIRQEWWKIVCCTRGQRRHSPICSQANGSAITLMQRA